MIDNTDLRLLTHSAKDALIVKYRRFIRVWQSSGSVEAAARILKMTPKRAAQTAGNLRSMGIPVKRYRQYKGGHLPETRLELIELAHSSLEGRDNTDFHKRFVPVWQKAASVEEVAKVFCMSEDSVKALASRMRKEGVPLKRFSDGPIAPNVKELTRLANHFDPNPPLHKTDPA